MIGNIRHPEYNATEWMKWRLAYGPSSEFISTYLKRFSQAEATADFERRKALTYLPKFAKSNIVEVRNSLYDRFDAIVRDGGSPSYRSAVVGEEGGVDLCGTSMNTFIGTIVLDELLPMGRVGVYVDMPSIINPTKTNTARPYLYVYKREDILTWEEDDDPTLNCYKSVLLRDHIYQYDEETGLPSGYTCRFRHYWKLPNGVVRYALYDDKSELIVKEDLDIPEIPLVIYDIGESFMDGLADYQIAMLNMASADVQYCVNANFSFYTEQFDPTMERVYSKNSGQIVTTEDDDGGVVVPDEGSTAKGERTIQVGPERGRRYPKGLERPGFISPSSEPLRASMDKQVKMQEEMRLIINLALTNLQVKMASDTSKEKDQQTANSGLAYIGLKLQDGERQIARIWHMYESKKPPTINYPTRYALMSEAQVREMVADLREKMKDIPSVTYKKVLAKRIVELMVSRLVTAETLKKIFKEIDDAEVVDVVRDEIATDVEGGYLDPELAAVLCGYPKETVKKAQEFRIERAKEIALSQTKGAGAVIDNPGARGVPDVSGDPNLDVKQEKDAAGNPVRGPAKGGSNG